MYTVLADVSSTIPSVTFAWWIWPVALLVFSFLLGTIAVVAGVGGGVLFVPFVGILFPFHLDFVRGAGLLVALTGALAASPGLLNRNLVNLRLALPMALAASTFSILGALMGLALPTYIVQIALGITILFVMVVMAAAKRSDFPEVKNPDHLSSTLRIHSAYYEESLGETIKWQVHRTPLGMVLFAIIGFMGGFFGLGAGWANVPVFNLVVGAPLKISVATSIFLISIANTTAVSVYMNEGAVLPLIVEPVGKVQVENLEEKRPPYLTCKPRFRIGRPFRYP